jgi:hypothetical protein
LPATVFSFIIADSIGALLKFPREPIQAQVVKLVDAGDSKSPAARRAGSIPALGTRNFFEEAAPLERLFCV